MRRVFLIGRCEAAISAGRIARHVAVNAREGPPEAPTPAADQEQA